MVQFSASCIEGEWRAEGSKAWEEQVSTMVSTATVQLAGLVPGTNMQAVLHTP